MKKLHKVALTAVVAMFALSASPLMENNNTNVAQAATKRAAHHKKLTKKARYAKIRKRGHVYVTTFAHGFYYKDAALRHRVAKRGYKVGKNLRIKKVVLYHGLQRYQLTNGEYITAYNADFNYNYTFKKLANKMVNHETIIKKARKAKKAKKYSKKKKANNKKKAAKKSNNNKQMNNNNTTVVMNGMFTESNNAPTDANADSYAGKHNEGDMWYQTSADNKGIVATFEFTNGKWVKQDNNNKPDNTKNASTFLNGKLTQSTNAPTDVNADPYAGKHNSGDIWMQLSADRKSTIATFVYSNNNWAKQVNNNNNNSNNGNNNNNSSNTTNNNQKNNNTKAAYTVAQDEMNNIYTSTSAPTDVQNISPLPISNDVWKQTDASGNVVNTYTFKDNNWVNDNPAKPAAQQPTSPAQPSTTDAQNKNTNQPTTTKKYSGKSSAEYKQAHKDNEAKANAMKTKVDQVRNHNHGPNVGHHKNGGHHINPAANK